MQIKKRYFYQNNVLENYIFIAGTSKFKPETSKKSSNESRPKKSENI